VAYVLWDKIASVWTYW